jgi:large subunit ribosomal protein L46
MNTWVVGNSPVGYYERKHKTLLQKESVSEIGQKTFFMKARIMAGQADLEQNKFGVSDFKWLAKEEISKTVDSHYWASVKNMLSTR